MSKLSDWLRQRNAITGIGSFIGLVSGVGAAYLTGSTGEAVAAGSIVFGAIHLVASDNGKLAADIQQLVVDTVEAAVEKKMAQHLPAILKDASQVMTDLATGPAAAPEAVQPSPTATAVAAGGLAAVVKAGGGLGMLAGLMMLAGLSACSTDQQKLACKVDQVAVPVAQTTLASLSPELATVSSVDALVVHPAVVKYCQSLGGTPEEVPAGTGVGAATSSTNPATTAPAAAASN